MPSRAELEAEYANQESITNNRSKELNNQSITNNRLLDTRVRSLHCTLQNKLNDPNYDIDHTYVIAKQFSDAEIFKVAEYCQRKATQHVGKAFVAIFRKKLRA